MCNFIFPALFKKKNKVYPSFNKPYCKVHPEPRRLECVV